MAVIDRLAQTFFRIGTEKGKDRPFGPLERKYLWTLPLAVTISLVGTALEGFSIGLLVPLLGTMLAGEPDTNVWAPLRYIADLAARISPGQPLLAIGGMMLLLVLVKNVVGTVGGLVISRIDGYAAADLRAMIAERLLRLPYKFYLMEDSPRLINVISSDSWRASEVMQSIYGIASSATAALVLSVAAMIANWKLFLIIVLGALAARALQRRLTARIKLLSDKVTETNRVLGERMLLIVDLARLIRVFNQAPNEQAMFERASDDVRGAMYDVERGAVLYSPAMELLLSTLFIVVLLLANNMNMTVPEILAFLVLQYRLQPQVLGVNQGILDLAAISGSVREVEWLLGNEEKPAPQGGRAWPGPIDSTIRFDDVTYTYPYDPQPVVHNASFEIPAGHATALIGRSGSGKSTLINLLTRLVDPDSGTIWHGDTPISAIDPHDWRARVALAGQDVDLVEGTVAENIAYRMPGLSADDIEQAARIADAHDFIMAMPGGYQARLDGYGMNLSGGQRQRIALARALVRRPDLLILDEATNAVDGISETVIMRLLREHQMFGSAVVISHRRSTLQACSFGVVVDHGRIIETGPLHTLNFYRDMERWPGDAVAVTD